MESITITKDEQDLFNIIKELGFEVRVAGGWVRDKLLGLSCHDMDIVVNKTTGIEFATKLKLYLEQKTEQTIKIGVITANPSKSKHLETATFQFRNYSIDVNHLRCESYASNSRIPSTIQMGTPLEDAKRRDLTINALFYNIHTNIIEDFCGTSLSDLVETKIIKTPLDPFQTFQDDPLRVLRAIRFAARFKNRGFTMDTNLIDAAKHVVTHKGLEEKVSRERIGIEIKKMLSYHNTFIYAYDWLYEFGLLPVIFGSKQYQRDQLEFCSSFLIQVKHKSMLLLASILYPLNPFDFQLQELLCLSSKEMTCIMKICKACDFLLKDQEEIGYFLWDYAQELWLESIILAASCSNDIVVETMKNQVLESGLLGCWDRKMLVNGNELMKRYGIQGKMVGQWLSIEKEWIIRHPMASKEECEEWLDSLQKINK